MKHQFKTTIYKGGAVIYVKVLSNEDFNRIGTSPGFKTDVHIVYVNILNGDLKSNSYKGLYCMTEINLSNLNWKLA